MPDYSDFYRQQQTPEIRSEYARKLRAQAQKETDPKKKDILNWVAGNYEKPVRESRASRVLRLFEDILNHSKLA